MRTIVLVLELASLYNKIQVASHWRKSDEKRKAAYVN